MLSYRNYVTLFQASWKIMAICIHISRQSKHLAWTLKQNSVCALVNTLMSSRSISISIPDLSSCLGLTNWLTKQIASDSYTSTSELGIASEKLELNSSIHHLECVKALFRSNLRDWMMTTSNSKKCFFLYKICIFKQTSFFLAYVQLLQS